MCIYLFFRIENVTTTIKREIYNFQADVFSALEDNEAFIALDNFLGEVFAEEPEPVKKVDK